MVDSQTRTGPGRIFYLLAAVPMVLGFGVMIVILAMTLPKMDDQLQQVVVPGERALALEPGGHTVFLETRSVVDGRVYAVDGVSGLAVRVEAEDGMPVPMVSPAASTTYSLGSRQGHSIGSFEIERAGTYRVSADYPGEAGPQTVIAVGQGFFGTLMGAIFSALAAVFLGLAASVGIAAWVFVKRRRARRAP